MEPTVKWSSRLTGRLLSVIGLVLAMISMESLASSDPTSAAATSISQISRPEEIFVSRCAACHALGIYAPTIDKLAKLREHDIENILWNGPMQDWANGLDGGQRALLARWIAGLSAEKESLEPGVKACGGEASASGQGLPSQQWAGWSADNELSRLSPSREFTVERTAALKLKWALPLPEGVPIAGGANPISISTGRLYTGNFNHFVYSLDPVRACAHWTFRAEGHVRSNVAIESGLLVFGDTWGNVYGLEEATGRLLWRVRSDIHGRITGNITLHHGVAYVPVSTLQEGQGIRVDIPCCRFRGSVLALDAKTGAEKWRHRTIVAPLERLGVSPKGIPRYGPAGVPVWSGIAIDDKRRSVYVTTGNQFSEPVAEESDAVLALDMETGSRKWLAGFPPDQMGKKDIFVLSCMEWSGAQHEGPCSPENPKHEGDRDFAAPPILIHRADGQDLVLAGSKDGMLYALNADDGKLVWDRRVGRGGEVGGIEYGIASDQERVYAPVADVEADLIAHASFNAVDLKSGKIIWSVAANTKGCEGKPTPPCNTSYMTPPTIAGDVVFAGNTDGTLTAFNRRTGKKVWSFDTVQTFTGPDGQSGTGGSLGFGGPTVVDNMLYVMSGTSLYGMAMGGNVLLAFELPPAKK